MGAVQTLELIVIVWLASGLFLPLLILGAWIADRLDAWQATNGGQVSDGTCGSYQAEAEAERLARLRRWQAVPDVLRPDDRAPGRRDGEGQLLDVPEARQAG